MTFWFQCWNNKSDAMDGSVLGLERNHVLKCWGCLSLKNWIGSHKLSLLLKLHPRKMEPWFVLWSFFLLRLPCISINIQYGIAWNTVFVLAGAPSYYLVMLDRLQRQICRTVHPSLAALLKPFAHSWNVASLSLFYRYYFGRCSSELAQLVPLPYSWERSTYYHDRLHHFYHHS